MTRKFDIHDATRVAEQLSAETRRQVAIIARKNGTVRSSVRKAEITLCEHEYLLLGLVIASAGDLEGALEFITLHHD